MLFTYLFLIFVELLLCSISLSTGQDACFDALSLQKSSAIYPTRVTCLPCTPSDLATVFVGSNDKSTADEPAHRENCHVVRCQLCFLRMWVEVVAFISSVTCSCNGSFVVHLGGLDRKRLDLIVPTYLRPTWLG